MDVGNWVDQTRMNLVQSQALRQRAFGLREQLLWRNRSLQEFLAAYALCRMCRDDQLIALMVALMIALIVRLGLAPTGHRFGVLRKRIATRTDPPPIAWTAKGVPSNGAGRWENCSLLGHQNRVAGGRAPT